MARTASIVLVFVVATLAASGSVHADESENVDPVPCVKVWTDPPDLLVDEACILKLLEDLPPAPSPP